MDPNRLKSSDCAATTKMLVDAGYGISSSWSKITQLLLVLGRGYDVDSQVECIPEEFQDRHCWVQDGWDIGLCNEEVAAAMTRFDREELGET